MLTHVPACFAPDGLTESLIQMVQLTLPRNSKIGTGKTCDDAEANRILADIWGMERAAGLAALGAGALGLIGAALAAVRRRLRAARMPRPPVLPEETASWL